MELQPEHFFSDFEITAFTARVKLKYLLWLKQCCKAVNLGKKKKNQNHQQQKKNHKHKNPVIFH